MKPLLLGHRGARASRHIPENTLASFELCMQHGCDGFEFDVRRSADGEAVICHDSTYRGMEIAKTPVAILALPTLEHVLQQFGARAFLDVELKVPGLEAQTIAALRKHPPQRGYMVSSFLPEVLGAVRGLDRETPLGLLYEKRASSAFAQLEVDWVNPRVDLVNQALVEEAHASGKRVMAWTVNRAEKMLQLSAWGVDAIISDETKLLVETVRTG
jgi:glycerophosphoryl diester phosphodiesterase